MKVVLSAADLLFLQCQKSELTPIPCSTFLSSVPKFSLSSVLFGMQHVVGI